jgi:hypothetical protein
MAGKSIPLGTKYRAFCCEVFYIEEKEKIIKISRVLLRKDAYS